MTIRAPCVRDGENIVIEAVVEFIIELMLFTLLTVAAYEKKNVILLFQ